MASADDSSPLRVENFLDCNGTLREFEIRELQQARGVLLYATERAPQTAPGYEFEAWSSSLGDALGRLRGKIRDGLSRRHVVEHPELGLQVLANRLVGRIGAGGLIIDGRWVSWDWLADQLRISEGWNFTIELHDSSE